MRQFTMYACPTGILAEQLSIYFAKSLGLRGRHGAHRYIPYCALTGLFRDQVRSIPLYLQVLDRLHEQWVRSRPNPGGMTLNQWTLQEGCHGLELDAPWLRQMMVQFICQAHSPTRRDMLRLKTWLPLCLLHGLDGSDPPNTSQAAMLPSLAQTPIQPMLTYGWELRFYEQRSPHEWMCHRSWPLQPYHRPAEDMNRSSRLNLAGQLAAHSHRTLGCDVGVM